MDNGCSTIGVLLLNLGGPDSLKAVKPFLYNLFSDREIIRLGPFFMQKPLAALISNLRSSKTCRMYGLIGEKSPILDITRAQADALEKALNRTPNPKLSFKVYIGMRYWHPFIEETVRQILKDGVSHLVVLSLYPHYSKTTTGSSMAEFRKAAEGKGLEIQYIEQWYDFPLYIDALCELISSGIEDIKDEGFVLLYSAHSLPKSFIDEGDPYLEHINGTINAVNRRLAREPYNIGALEWHLAFQSKSGPVKWLEPSTHETIIRLSKEGCKNLFVVPISFVSDHIETLYEIDILFKELSEKHNINLKRCLALNTSAKFIEALKELVIKKLKEGNR
jgi:protoporphyrin/coproporphyrin ferrochelatase